MNSKTGEWDVHEKDLPGTPMPPYVHERQFAGWSVETNKISLARAHSTGHDSWQYSESEDIKTQDKRLDHSVSKKR